jgi:signal transduction histidine kinase
MKKRRSIASGILFWMIIVAVTPLLIMSFQGYHCARQAVLQLKLDHLETVSEARRQSIMVWLDERANELRSHGATMNDAACNCSAGELLNINPAYESITLFSNDWNRISFFGPDTHSTELLLPPAFRERLESETEYVVSPPHLHPNGVIGIHIGIAIPEKKRYAVAVLDLTPTLYPILTEPLGSGGAILSYIRTADGRVLNPSDGTFQVLEAENYPPHTPEHTEHLMPYIGLFGDQVVGTAVPLEGLDWMLISEAPARDALAWMRILRTRAAVTGVITLAFVIVLARLSTRRITRPLRHLADVAHEVADGRYTTRMQIFPAREHAEVAEAFNRMLDEIDRAQARLAQAAALSAIGELSASIVHEMRNPLSAIKMNLEVLQQAVADDPVHRELGEIAAEQVQRLKTMLDDLLQYGKMIALEKVEVPIEEFMQKIEACIRYDESKTVAFSFSNKSDVSMLQIDREHMLRAVSNLVDNAVQAAPADSTVYLTAQRDADGNGVILEVADAGPGISGRVAEKLFEPFYTTKKKGTGLGLANVKKIVELHGGTISFRNTNPGTAFTITLPTDREPT